LSVNDLLAEGFRPSYMGEAVPACKSLARGKPFFAETAPEQRACALRFVRDGVNEIMVSVDGGPPQDVLDDRFLSVTDQFSVVSQPGNPFGAEPGPTTLAAAGYEAVLRGIPPGPHSYVVFGDAFGEFTAHFTFNVLPGAER
jgi:hypothetical protein